jgi:hypothetical protein
MSGVGPFAHAIREREVPPDRKVAEIAERQHGVVTYEQLLELGLGRGAIHHRVKAGRLYRVHIGVYVVGHRRLEIHGRWMAAVLSCGDALLSHQSAAALWGILVTSGSLIDVMPVRRTRHRRSGLVVHRPRLLHAEDRAVEQGIPVTSVTRTLLDLAQVVQSRQLARAVDEADRLELLDARKIDPLMARSNGHPGLGRFRAALRDHRGPSPLTRSELERRFFELCRKAGLPLPQMNVLVAGFEVDAVWHAQRVIVELDGYAFHRTRARFEDDRARDATLQLAGYRVLRFTHRRLVDEPQWVIDTLSSLLGGAAAD